MKKLAILVAVIGIFAYAATDRVPQVTNECFEPCFNQCIAKNGANAGTSDYCRKQCYTKCDTNK